MSFGAIEEKVSQSSDKARFKLVVFLSFYQEILHVTVGKGQTGTAYWEYNRVDDVFSVFPAVTSQNVCCQKGLWNWNSCSPSPHLCPLRLELTAANKLQLIPVTNFGVLTIDVFFSHTDYPVNTGAAAHGGSLPPALWMANVTPVH